MSGDRLAGCRVPQVSLVLRDLGGALRSSLVTDRPSLIFLRSIHDRRPASILSTQYGHSGWVGSQFAGFWWKRCGDGSQVSQNQRDLGQLTAGTPAHHERFWPRSSLVTDRPSLIFLRSIHDRGPASILSIPVLAFRLGLVRSLQGSGGSVVARAPRSRKHGETWGTLSSITLTSGTPTRH